MITAAQCYVSEIETVYDRNSKVKKVWCYNIHLIIIDNEIQKLPLADVKKLDGYSAYTMRLPVSAYKNMKIKKWDKVKALEYDRGVCAIFDKKGNGFMFTNIPFEC